MNMIRWILSVPLAVSGLGILITLPLQLKQRKTHDPIPMTKAEAKHKEYLQSDNPLILREYADNLFKILKADEAIYFSHISALRSGIRAGLSCSILIFVFTATAFCLAPKKKAEPVDAPKGLSAPG